MSSASAFIRLCAVGSLGLLVFPIYQLFTSGRSPLAIALTLAAVAIFAAVYVEVWLGSFLIQRQSLSLGGVVLLAAIATTLNLVYPGLVWTYLFVYLAGTAGFVLPGRLGIAGVTGTILAALATLLAAAGALPPPVRSQMPRIAVSTALALALVGLAALAARRLVEIAVEMRAAREEIARRAIEEERQRFARDLHDLLGNSLSLIALKSALAGRLLSDRTAPAAEEVGDIERVARRALGEMREAVRAYRRPALTTEIAGARAALAAAGIEFHADAVDHPLPQGAEATLAWVVREGVTNVLRHSRARRCTLQVLQRDGTAELAITDDGDAETAGERGSGLLGLQERVEASGGRLEAVKLPHRGFLLRATVPTGAPKNQWTAGVGGNGRPA